MNEWMPDRCRAGFAVVFIAVLLLSPTGGAGADADHGVDPEGWVISAEEEALCRRALRECTPIIAGIARQQRDAEANAKRLRGKLRRQEEKSATEAAGLALRIENLERELEAMKGSTSWWLTTPLRFLYALVFGP